MPPFDPGLALLSTVAAALLALPAWGLLTVLRLGGGRLSPRRRRARRARRARRLRIR